MRKAIAYLLIIVLTTGVGAGWYLYQSFIQELDQPLAISPTEKYLLIDRGTGFKQIAAEFQRRGFVESPLLLRVFAEQSGMAKKIRAGEYELASGLTLRKLLDKLVRGEVAQHSITLVDGLRFLDFRKTLVEDERLVRAIGALSESEIMTRLGAPGISAEGRFLPETYYFTRGASDLEILKRAYNAMDKALAEEWEGRSPDAVVEDQNQALILASIVERESGAQAERGKVAGVFNTRLRIGMRLQSDPTTIYGLGERYDGNLRRADLSDPSPYNTYVHGGLPPMPIANPSRASIHAALHPEPGEYLYFVAQGDGTHYFSKTLSEHNAAVNRYQLKRAKDYRSAPSP